MSLCSSSIRWEVSSYPRRSYLCSPCPDPAREYSSPAGPWRAWLNSAPPPQFLSSVSAHRWRPFPRKSLWERDDTGITGSGYIGKSYGLCHVHPLRYNCSTSAESCTSCEAQQHGEQYFTLIGNRMKGGRACWSMSSENNLAALLYRYHTRNLFTKLWPIMHLVSRYSLLQG